MSESRKFRVWLDSGANHNSCREEIVSLDDIGLSSEEWDAMSEKEQTEIMKEISWDQMDWGFREITNES